MPKARLVACNLQYWAENRGALGTRAVERQASHANLARPRIR